MKLFIFIVVFCTTVSYSKWEKVYEDDFAVDWLDVHCINNTNCLAVAIKSSGGAINSPVAFKSTDGGETWSHSLIDTISWDKEGNYLYKHRPFDFSYPTEDFCIITCDSGDYWVSYDALQTWKLRNKSDLTNPGILISVEFVDNKTGYMTSGNKIFKSTDGAKTWKNVLINPPPYLIENWDDVVIRVIKCFDENTIYATIIGGFDGTVFAKTFDGGNNWIFTSPNEELSSDAVDFVNKKNGFSFHSVKNENDVYRALFLKTTDSANTWEKYLDTVNRYNNSSCKSIKFYDEKHGYALASWYTIWHTDDGGNKWELKEDYHFDSLQYFMQAFEVINTNEIIGLAQRPNQVIYKYTPNTTSVYVNYAQETTFLISPNPASEYIEISIPENHRVNPVVLSEEIAIYDVLGNVVYSTKDTERSRSTEVSNDGHFDYAQCPVRIDISHLPRGVYFVRVGDRIEKFVKL